MESPVSSHEDIRTPNFLKDTQPSVVGLCETWLPLRLTFILPGYAVIREFRQQGRGGGVLLVLREELKYTARAS